MLSHNYGGKIIPRLFRHLQPMLKRFTTKLIDWHRANKRDMPWKKTNDPYKIWLSEIILQQTRVEQGTPYYEHMVQRFPTVSHLAGAAEEDVLKAWEGLGYYSRARNLHAAAKQVVDDYAGRFPDSYENIISLKGIGPYSAAAISSFAFNLPHAVVDGNVYRLLARYFGISVPIDSTKGRNHFAELAQKLIDKKHPGEYNQAIMNFGAMICKPVPECGVCIFKKQCIAFRENRIEDLPLKEKKNSIRVRWFNFLVIAERENLVIERRKEKDIWKGLYQFPLLETEKFSDNGTIKKMLDRQGIVPGKSKITGLSEVIRHQLTHQTIFSQFITMDVKHKEKWWEEKGFLAVKRSELAKYAFPKLITNYIKKHLS
jgi:A/G-specific adenine glycosylase